MQFVLRINAKLVKSISYSFGLLKEPFSFQAYSKLFKIIVVFLEEKSMMALIDIDFLSSN